jgi:formylglycine-generating enzyme required for sulfatase activity
MKIITGKSFSLPLKPLPNDVKPLNMVWISPGTFTMGFLENEPDRMPEDVEIGYFEATLSRGFWLGQYQVTQMQWQEVMKDNPSHYQPCPDCPVENISWYQAMAFCAELNQIVGSILPSDYQFSLPTQAQWEYCCRAGTQTLYSTGNNPADLSRAAWHKENSEGHPHPVGEKMANPWGLYDMHGNVGEWCYDPMKSPYPRSPTVDWVGQADWGFRSLRGGGGWGTMSTDTSFRCSSRMYLEPEKRLPFVGFRLCLRVLEPKN